MPWKIDPFSQARDAFKISWTHKFVYSFPNFALLYEFIGRVLQKVNHDQCLMLIITPAWPGQTWFPRLLKMSVKNPLLLPALKDLLKDLAGKLNPFAMQNSLRIKANFLLAILNNIKECPCQQLGQLKQVPAMAGINIECLRHTQLD